MTTKMDDRRRRFRGCRLRRREELDEDELTEDFDEDEEPADDDVPEDDDEEFEDAE